MRQDQRKNAEKKAEDVRSWQREHRAVVEKRRANGGASSSSGSGGNVAARKVKRPEKIDCNSLRDLLPNIMPKPRVWHETQTNRIRGSYTRRGHRVTSSADLEKLSEDECCSVVVKWIWQQHLEATGELCPFEL